MPTRPRPPVRSAAVVALLLVAAAGVACGLHEAGGDTPPSGDGNPNGAGTTPTPPPRPPDQVDDEAGIGHRPRDGSVETGPRPGRDSGPKEEAGPQPDDSSTPDVASNDSSSDDASSDATDAMDAATPDTGSPDAGPLLCASPPGAGDLAIVEMMIQSQNSVGDEGEWLEVQSTQPSCAFNLNGLHVAVPRGAVTYTLDVLDDIILPANGIFVIADSLDPSVNDHLPVTPILFAWAGAPVADVLSNGAGSVTVSFSGTTVEALSWPAFQLIIGTSISFPADCAWSYLTDWTRWSYSNNFWFSTFQGTPNADNTDVTCF